jgi:hypothetical protein
MPNAEAPGSLPGPPLTRLQDGGEDGDDDQCRPEQHCCAEGRRVPRPGAPRGVSPGRPRRGAVGLVGRGSEWLGPEVSTLVVSLRGGGDLKRAGLHHRASSATAASTMGGPAHPGRGRLVVLAREDGRSPPWTRRSAFPSLGACSGGCPSASLLRRSRSASRWVSSLVRRGSPAAWPGRCWQPHTSGATTSRLRGFHASFDAGAGETAPSSRGRFPRPWRRPRS